MLILTVVVSRKFYRLLVLVLSFSLVVCLAACGKEIDPYGNYDDVTKTLKLKTKYTETSSFLTDGAGLATLSKLTDGDTTDFTLSGGQYVTIRYHGIDTPESTGGVEKWGKAASNFVRDKLSAAVSIVLESTEIPAKKDSYGSRYLGYVWYKTSENEDYKNLNMELVENGYTVNKCINTPAFKYYTEFKKAEDFAKSNKLRVHGDYKDPLYSTAAIKITLKDFYDNPDLYYNKEAQSGAKVRFQAYITELEVSQTGTYNYVATQIVDGKKYNIALYGGYSSSPATQFITMGNLYSITGSVDVHNNQYQVKGLTYVAMQTGGDYLTELQSNYYCTFNSGINYESKWGTCLFTDVTVKSAKVENGVLTIVGDTAQKAKNGEKEVEEYTFTVNVDETYDASTLVGKKFSTTGIQEVKKSKIISVEKIQNIVIKG